MVTWRTKQSGKLFEICTRNTDSHIFCQVYIWSKTRRKQGDLVLTIGGRIALCIMIYLWYILHFHLSLILGCIHFTIWGLEKHVPYIVTVWRAVTPLWHSLSLCAIVGASHLVSHQATTLCSKRGNSEELLKHQLTPVQWNLSNNVGQNNIWGMAEQQLPASLTAAQTWAVRTSRCDLIFRGGDNAISSSSILMMVICFSDST